MVRWTWQVAGDPASFKAYTLVTGKSSADVLSRSGSALSWTSAQNPELGRYNLPSSVADIVRSTITDGHAPAAAVFAQLVATDTLGRTSSTPVVSATTAPQPASQLVIFSEVDTAGYSLPDTFKFTTGTSGSAGTHYYEYLSTCPAGQSACWENLRRQDLQIGLSGLPAGSFAGAYLELALACTGETSWWSDMWLNFSGTTPLWHFDAFTLRCDGKYRIYQIPLRAFEASGSALQHANLGAGLFEVMAIGGNWTSGSRVRVDEIRLRW